MQKDEIILPLFPLPGVVLFPGMDLPLHIFEEQYKKLISKCLEKEKSFGVIYAKGKVCAEVGTLAEIIDVEELEEGKMNILVEGKIRFKIVSFVSETPYYEAVILPYEDTEQKITADLKKIIKQIKENSTKALKIFDQVSNQELSKKLKLPRDPNELLFLVAANLTCPHEIKQTILETRSIKVRADKVLGLLREEIERLEVLLENKETKGDVIKNGKLKI